MIQYYAFDITVRDTELEILLAECISDGFAGYNETDDGENVKIAFYYNSKDSAAEVRNSLLEKYSVSEIQEIENRNWNEEWKKTVKPVKITDKIWVSPKWLEPTVSSGESWIKIEPQMAFGTGHHETTRIAAKLIEESAGGTLLDIGTGSGVLAFVAQIVGYKSVIGVEIDEDCRENLQKNLEDNKGRSDIRFFIGGINKINKSAKFDTIVMNMIRSESVPLLEDICEILSPDGFLLWSGILLEEKEKVISEAKKFCFELQSETVENEWWGAKFIRR
jgi:ribosomal protein L11 methyltransferase